MELARQFALNIMETLSTVVSSAEHGGKNAMELDNGMVERRSNYP